MTFSLSFQNNLDSLEVIKLDRIIIIMKKTTPEKISIFLKTFEFVLFRSRMSLVDINKKTTKERSIPKNPLPEPLYGSKKKAIIRITTRGNLLKPLKVKKRPKIRGTIIAKYAPKELGSLNVELMISPFTTEGVFPKLISLKCWKRPNTSEIKVLVIIAIKIFFTYSLELSVFRRIKKKAKPVK